SIKHLVRTIDEQVRTFGDVVKSDDHEQHGHGSSKLVPTHSQWSTPPCDEQVPDRLCENEYVTSRHCAVAPAGGLDALYGEQTVLPAEFTYVPLGQFWGSGAGAAVGGGIGLKPGGTRGGGIGLNPAGTRVVGVTATMAVDQSRTMAWRAASSVTEPA